MNEHRMSMCVFQMLRSWPDWKDEFTLDGQVDGWADGQVNSWVGRQRNKHLHPPQGQNLGDVKCFWLSPWTDFWLAWHDAHVLYHLGSSPRGR